MVTLDRTLEVMVWVIHALEQLKEKGLVAGGSVETTDKAIGPLDAIRSFAPPSNLEIADALPAVGRDCSGVMLSLVIKYRDGELT